VYIQTSIGNDEDSPYAKLTQQQQSQIPIKTQQSFIRSRSNQKHTSNPNLYPTTSTCESSSTSSNSPRSSLERQANGRGGNSGAKTIIVRTSGAHLGSPDFERLRPMTNVAEAPHKRFSLLNDLNSSAYSRTMSMSPLTRSSVSSYVIQNNHHQPQPQSRKSMFGSSNVFSSSDNHQQTSCTNSSSYPDNNEQLRLASATTNSPKSAVTNTYHYEYQRQQQQQSYPLRQHDSYNSKRTDGIQQPSQRYTINYKYKIGDNETNSRYGSNLETANMNNSISSSPSSKQQPSSSSYCINYYKTADSNTNKSFEANDPSSQQPQSNHKNSITLLTNMTPGEQSRHIEGLESEFDMLMKHKQQLDAKLSRLPSKANNSTTYAIKENVESELNAVEKKLASVKLELRKLNVIKTHY
jgi:hypothetical protein